MQKQDTLTTPMSQVTFLMVLAVSTAYSQSAGLFIG